jgi:membrane-bound ClpP family serine protease
VGLTLIILFLVVGLIFLLVEILITPGFILGAIGILFMAFGIYKSYQDYGTSIGNIVLVSVFVITVFIVFLALKTGVWDRMASKETISSKATQSNEGWVQVGDQGKAVSALRPSGNALFNGRKGEVTSEGETIENGTEVKVSRLAQNKVFVRKVVRS